MHTNNSIGSLPMGNQISDLLGGASYASPWALASDLSNTIDDTLVGWMYPNGFPNPRQPIAPIAPQTQNELTNPNFWNPAIMYNTTATASLANRGSAIPDMPVNNTQNFSNMMLLAAIGVGAFLIFRG
jgi:hypothetical protein